MQGDLKPIARQFDANHNDFQQVSVFIFRLEIDKHLIIKSLPTIKIQRVFASTCLLFFSKGLPEERFVKKILISTSNSSHGLSPPIQREERAKLRDLPQPLPRREAEVARKLDYNSLRNYALRIVFYELNKIQHCTFNIKNYALCIVHYELT